MILIFYHLVYLNINYLKSTSANLRQSMSDTTCDQILAGFGWEGAETQEELGSHFTVVTAMTLGCL